MRWEGKMGGGGRGGVTPYCVWCLRPGRRHLLRSPDATPGH